MLKGWISTTKCVTRGRCSLVAARARALKYPRVDWDSICQGAGEIPARYWGPIQGASIPGTSEMPSITPPFHNRALALSMKAAHWLSRAGKGRGIIASRQVKKGALLMICSPLVFAEAADQSQEGSIPDVELLLEQ